MWGGMVAFVFGSVGGCRSETTGTDLRVCRGSSFVSRGATVSRFSVSKKRTDRSTAKIVMVTSTGLKKVVIAGGTGFIGTYLSRNLVDDGCDEVVVLTRGGKRSSVRAVVCEDWDPANIDGDWVDALKGADAVVNLCGELIVQRWSEAVKKRLVDSRLTSTNALVEAMGKLSEAERPKAFVSSSAVGYYGISESLEFTETSQPGKDFLADLCVKWEQAAEAAKALGIRVVIMRNGIVLGRGGGALNVMMPLFNLALGGNLGSGKQFVSWVSVKDVAAAFELAAGTPSMSGVYNLTAPQPCTSAEMTKALASALGRPAIFPAPAFAIKAALLEGATVLLDGQKVLPDRLLKERFPFQFETITEVMKDAVNS